MSKHYQIEGNMTMTGTNADARFPMANSKHGVLLANLYNLLRGKMGLGIDETIEVFELPGNNLATVANDLWDSRGASLVISGSNNANEQSIVNSINALLGNYDETIDITNASNISSYDEVAFDGFVSDLNSGRVGAVIFVNTNPVYSYSKGAKLAAALAKTKVISTTSVLDESAAKANINAPDNHGLESWDVFEPIEGYYTTAQPVISKVFNTRAAAESLLLWSGVKLAENTENQASYAWVNDFISSKGGNSEKVIHDGFLDLMSSPSAPAFTGNTASAIAGLTKSKNGLEVALYQKVGVKDGSNSFNPWAHEMPDPVTKVTYDNYVLISKSDAEANDLENGAFISVKAANGSVDLPVFIQPGQAKNTLGIALGYGRTVVTSAENDLVNLGKNAYPLMAANGETCIQGVTIEKLNETYEFAQTQTHHTIEGRDYMREATLGEYKENNNVRNEHPPHIVSLWDEVDYSKGHHWGMAIDMNACTGCGSCIVSCSIENNVPVVGRDEVRRRREMHWIRIDRYYAFEVSESQDITVPLFGGRSKEKGEYVTKETEIAGLDENNTTNHYAHYDNVSVVHQAVMCQHCDHAPCETVCPVLATTHSSEGLNQMTYNRCIGTKYCANNCPYKVRRFNWFRYNMNDKFDYHFNSELGRMVLNPDVTVRSRGVMEKCSFCVQNIQLAKLNAKRASTTMKDGDVSVACAKACPSNAIVFGDRNDPESKIAKLFKNDRAYKMLEEIDTAPSVVYLTKIRNKKEAVKAENSHS
ncbi:MAG: Fe-S-cluster-containing dehydrogenase component [Bacteroidia bacterium]|jgi:Fe-S-cluster-containing dehydrogenase component